MTFNWTDEPGKLAFAVIAVSVATIVTNAATRLACNLMKNNSATFEEEPGYLIRSSRRNCRNLIVHCDPGSLWD